MKKFFLMAVLFLLTLTAYSQHDVTKFLGIPVDGSKSEMIRKLKAKGFQQDPASDVLVGEFNGAQVNVSVVTNNNKVYRICLSDAIGEDERSIQIRFNKLCKQFENNAKYIDPGNSKIPGNEDLSYEITVHNKRYQAVYFQKPEKMDTTVLKQQFHDFLLTRYSEEDIANPSKKIKEEFENLEEDFLKDFFTKRPVWFMIDYQIGKFYILMYYDNEYNHANGEDL